MIQRERTTVQADEVAFFEKYYENTAYNLTGWRLRLKRELRSLRKTAGLKRLDHVLSIGCGDGQFEMMLAPFAKQITALDISPKAIEVAKRKAAKTGITNIDFRCLSMSELRWEEQYDAIICLAFLHHVRETDLPGFLYQSYAHLKPGGFFYSQDPNINGVLRKIGRATLGAQYDKYHSPDERELDPKQLAALLRLNKFDSVRISYIDLTLIPALFLLANRPSWPLYLCPAIDWLWCHSPLARWASGFNSIAWKKVKWIR